MVNLKRKASERATQTSMLHLFSAQLYEDGAFSHGLPYMVVKKTASSRLIPTKSFERTAYLQQGSLLLLVKLGHILPFKTIYGSVPAEIEMSRSYSITAQVCASTTPMLPFPSVSQ